jgi:hypothetical protein
MQDEPTEAQDAGKLHKNAGAFRGPAAMIHVPVRTPSDDYADHPTYPEDERVPEPTPPSLVRRVLDRLVRRPTGDR